MNLRLLLYFHLAPLAFGADSGMRVLDLSPEPEGALQAAIDSLDADAPYTVLRLAPGTYREKIRVEAGAPAFKLLGQSPETTRIVWGDAADTPGADGTPLGTFRSSSVIIESNNFAAENITFENDRGPGIQAVAMSVGGDRAVFRNCRFLGWQDTLLLRKKRQFFDRCHIAGSVDFIFGDATAFFSRCVIECRDKGYITAASTPESSEFGFVFSECTVTAPSGKPFYLGRPWRPHASVHFLNCALPAEVRPEGWENWRNPENEKTARYYEYGSSGKGAASGERVPWSKMISEPRARGASRLWHVLSKWDPEADLSPERVSRLPLPEQAAWWGYLRNSREAAARDRAILLAEIEAAGLESPLCPSSRSRADDDRAAAIISFQTPSGGWSKSIDYTKGPREPGMHWSSQGGGNFPWHYVGTIDNGATVGEIRFLARYYDDSRRKKAREAVERGLDYLATARFPTGGWPQVWPLQGSYHDHITLNDDAMANVLALLHDVATGKAPFEWVAESHREEAAEGLRDGVACLLAAQVMQGGGRSVWCAQHDPLTLAPAGGRLQEPASLSSYESVEILRFLMQSAPQTPETIAAIRAGADWFRRSALTGIRRETRNGRTFYAEGTDGTEPWWGRFHDLATNRPIFSGARDGWIYESFAELFPGNPTEYQYYTTRARKFLSSEFPAWLATTEP